MRYASPSENGRIMIASAYSDELTALAALLRASTVAVRGRCGSGAGSGVIWSSDGIIVTNAHVVREWGVDVELADGRVFPAQIEARDVEGDLAKLRIAATGLPAATIRDPKDLRVGELLVAMGNPHGIQGALTLGIAHATRGSRFVTADVRLAPGKSGGPLADVQGRVVGVNSMVANGDLAIAVPSDVVQRFLGLTAPTPLLGIRYAPVRMRERVVLAVLGVEPQSRAAGAGLIVGDLILEVNGRPIRGEARLVSARALSIERRWKAAYDRRSARQPRERRLRNVARRDLKRIAGDSGRAACAARTPPSDHREGRQRHRSRRSKRSRWPGRDRTARPYDLHSTRARRRRPRGSRSRCNERRTAGRN